MQTGWKRGQNPAEMSCRKLSFAKIKARPDFLPLLGKHEELSPNAFLFLKGRFPAAPAAKRNLPRTGSLRNPYGNEAAFPQAHPARKILPFLHFAAVSAVFVFQCSFDEIRYGSLFLYSGPLWTTFFVAESQLVYKLPAIPYRIIYLDIILRGNPGREIFGRKRKERASEPSQGISGGKRAGQTGADRARAEFQLPQHGPQR